MVLFINDIKITIKKSGATVNEAKYQSILSTFKKVNISKWSSRVLLLYPTSTEARKIFDRLESGEGKLKSLSIVTKNPKSFIKKVFEDFKVLKAGGGIVENDKGELLMIFRNGFWDFPKGKLETGETILECSEREVEEECGVKVSIISRICKTKHTYLGSKKKILKTTYWYSMKLLDDSKMAPETKEGIEKVEWKTPREAEACLATSFTSLRYLYSKY